MKRRLFVQDGFTLIELMIVVAIIGILAAIAIPNFMNYQCKAKQSEAKINLSNVRTMETAYFATHDIYSTSATTIGFETKGNPLYTYTITSTDNSANFTATATGNLDTDAAEDVWSVTEAHVITHGTNDCN